MKIDYKELVITSILLTIVVFIAHHFSSFLEEMVVAGNMFAWVMLFLWYAMFILVFLIIKKKL